MTHRIRNPGAGRRQGFDLDLVVQAGSEIEGIALSQSLQDHIAVRRLITRFGVTPSTAAAIAAANSYGASQ